MSDRLFGIRASRRSLLKLFGASVAAASLPSVTGCSPSGDDGASTAQAAATNIEFFTPGERRVIGALADEVLPPDDQPGGQRLGAVIFIERFLTALEGPHPTLWAGGPFRDQFTEFLPLDRVSLLAWRLALYGSDAVGGGPNDAVIGKTPGLRNDFKRNLALLSNDPSIEDFEDEFRVTFIDLVTQAAYGDPAYGGNPNRAGWKAVYFDGDSAPRGFSQLDPVTNTFKERPEAPLSTPNPGQDPEKMSFALELVLGTATSFFNGKVFTMSNQPVGNTNLTQFDAIVIGSGCGGSAATYVLCKNGKKVLVLEAGTNWFEDLENPNKQPTPKFSNDEVKLVSRRFISPHPLAEPRSFRKSEKDGVRTFVGDVNSLPKTVGGGGVHADLKTPRFQASDFQLGTLLGNVPGASFADWPVQYDELEAFYARAETVLGVQGQDDADPFASKRSTKYIMPPGAPMYMGLKVSDGAKKLGLNPFPYPAAVNSREYDGRPACVDCGWCSGYGCPTNAKGSPPVTTLRRALLTGNCLLLPETRAVKLLTNASGTEITGVETIGPDGKRKVYQADRYVLAASPIEDVRLLYLSGQGNAIGNTSGLVGRNLMFHYQTVAVGVFKERLHGHRGRTVSHGFSDFRGVPGDKNRPLGGIVEIGSYIGPISEADYVRQILNELPTGFDGEIYKDILRQSPFRDRLVGLTMQAEDAPQPTNVVDLDPDLRDIDGLPVARVTYNPHQFELSASEFYSPKLLEVLGKSGAKYTFITPQPDISESAHVMGTLRMGADPKTSVCNKDGRFHDIGNLYNADGALFPTSSGYNPTLTLMALAMRVGAAMVNGTAPETAIAGGPLD